MVDDRRTIEGSHGRKKAPALWSCPKRQKRIHSNLEDWQLIPFVPWLFYLPDARWKMCCCITSSDNFRRRSGLDMTASSRPFSSCMRDTLLWFVVIRQA
jgi:hypothetical protein